MFHTSIRRVAVLLSLIFLAAPSAMAQETGHGDVFGDLVHIKRSPVTGQPILQKRLIESDWVYCPIPIDASGAEIPFASDSCDVDPTQLSRLVEVDYFGRLSGGRTKERNLRMHLDEVINNIINSEAVDLEPGGRLKFGTGCTTVPGGPCTSWKVIDSPQENMALYHRLMKYGHIQTNPLEVDTSFHGDPELGTVFHPALRAEDWLKFRGVTANLLPRGSAGECFNTHFTLACAAPQALTAEDFVRAASFLAGAADKHGKITVDLVQYLNRILKITEATPDSAATVNTLPALIREEDGVTINPAPVTPPLLPAPADELFVDFGAAAYLRTDRFAQSIPALVPAGPGLWAENPSVPLLPFLLYVNGPVAPATNMTAFQKNASDGLRAIEFIHEYEIPVDLYAVYSAPTTTTVENVTAKYSAADRTVTLTATVANSSPINAGTVTFTVQTSVPLTIGAPVTSGTVTNGTATASYVLPGGTEPQTLQVVAAYSGGPGLAASSGTGTLTITPPPLPEELLAIENARADFNADNKSDLLVQSLTTGVLSAWLLEGHTVTTTQDLSHPILDSDWRIVGTGDFNGDGNADIVLHHLTEGWVYLWYMSGTTRIDATYFSRDRVEPGWKMAGVGDFNDDGKPDLVWHNQAQGRIAFWLCDGVTVTSTPEASAQFVDIQWTVAGVGDFDQDGESDLLLQHLGNGEVGVWLMDGTTRRGFLALTPGVILDLAWQVAAIIDANGDTRPDIVWQHTTSGALAIWYMNGTVRTDVQSLTVSLPAGSRVGAPK